MKISKKIVVALCIIVSILAIALLCVLWFNQKPNFSKYHSYAILTYDKDLLEFYEIPLTDEQFQQIVDIYTNDETLFYDYWNAKHYLHDGAYIKLYKTNDMSGRCVYMQTGYNDGKHEMCLWIGDKCFPFDNPDTATQVIDILREAFKQYESEQEL